MAFWLALGLCTVFGLGGGTAIAGDQHRKTSGTKPTREMHLVFEAISHLLPLAVSEERWADPGRDAEISKWLDALARRTAALEAHAQARDAGFRHLSRTLTRDVEDIRERRARGHLEESRFFMIEATGTCVACHSRLPSESAFPLAEKLMMQIESESLSPHERVQFLVATRQFDAALDVWEALFMDLTVPPAQVDISGYFLDYFTVGIRVRRDPARVRTALERFALRDDVPRYLQRHLAGWIAALGEIEPVLSDPDRIARARALIEATDQSARASLSREGMIYDVAASSLLLQHIDDAGDEDASLAEALFLLGLVEARNVDSFWVPLAEVHLEAAIRLQPRGKFADDAYDVLEEHIVLGYGGASGQALPPDVAARLSDLRGLIDGKRVR